MLSLCDCSEEKFAVPQNAITPNDLYQMSLRGEDLDLKGMAYVPPANGKALDEPPLEHMRGTDIVDLWNKQNEVADEKLRVARESSDKHYYMNKKRD